MNAPCRLEFQLTFAASPAGGQPAEVPACGINIAYNSGFLQIYSTHLTGLPGVFLVPISGLASNWGIIRYQQIPSGAGGSVSMELWNISGTLVYSQSYVYTGTSGSNSPGASVGSTGSQDSSWGFFRLYTTTVPLASGEPTFSDNGNLLEWKFNATLTDGSGRGYTATSSAGTPANPCGSPPCYETSLGQDLVTAVIKATPAPIWGNPPVWRAGTTVGLDGSASISMGDSSGTPALFWQILSGPSIPILSSHTATRPTLTGIVFGNYRVQLVATNPNGGSATTIQDIGAVAQDSNGVVVNADPNVDKIFGPMIALGKNPWGWADERHFRAIELQQAYQVERGYHPPPFVMKGAGTIAYKYGGNFGCTTLSSGIDATTLSIPVTNATCLDLSTLPTTPTHIRVEAEWIRICSTSATSGPATLTACYDGRGMARGAWGYQGTPTQVAASSHSSGAAVGDSMVTGTSTLFATDANRAVCPAGVPGPPGPVVYSTGTLTMSAGSAVVTGSGTTWNTSSGVIAGNMIRIAATHASGTAFIFWAVINSVNSTTQLTLSRPAPSDIDGTGFAYKITNTLLFAPEATIPGTSSVTNVGTDIVACESETRLSMTIAFEGGAINGTTMSGVKYSYKIATGATSFSFQPNYYGVGLAARALYYRSGYGPALTLANNIDENWVNDPEVCAGYCWNFGIRAAGGFIGAIASKVLNPDTTLSWDHLRYFGTASGLAAATGNCSYSDTRDTGAIESFVSLLALFDTAQQSNWNGILHDNANSWYAWDQACKSASGHANSWANSLYFAPTTKVTLTSGSTSVVAVTGTFSNDPNATNGCGGLASGTATATAGSDILTRISGTFSVGAPQIAITGSRLGNPYTLWIDYRSDTANQLTLGGKWPADANTGTVTWTTVASPFNVTVFATDNTESAAMAQNFACTYVDPTHITLNRAWPLSTSSTRFMYSANIAGTGQQPFMLGGAKSLALQWAALNSNPTIAAAFNTEFQQAAGWMFSTGFSPYTLGPFYARIFQPCEPVIVPSTNFLGTFQSACANLLEPGAIIASRTLTAETTTALRAYYASQGDSSAAKLWADTQYGALWCRTGYDTGGVYCDSASAGNNIGLSNLTDTFLGSFKWPGFFFGMGMVHQWPAARLGGVAPAAPRTVSVSCNISSVTNATKCRVTLTKPDGSTVTNTCTTNPCSVTADARQGDHLLEVDYLSASNVVLAAGEPVPVRVN